jgi:short subunit dehydrogenase-like uncharacterized protein
VTPHHGTASRDLDVVLFGATGFTGRLVAEYLARRGPALRWALAGRSHHRLAALRDELAAVDPAAASLPLLVVDSADAAAVHAVVRRARVVCTTVGPYGALGMPLVAACAAQGVHYCDVTGETPFIRAAIDAHHARAAATGARIVHCCGFDSVPSDLGVHLLHRHLAAQGDRLRAARTRVVRLRARPSRGTAATLLDLYAQSAAPTHRDLLADPYALDPRDAPPRPPQRDQLGPRLDADTQRWTAPFVMAPINTRVVRRSNALLGFAYGRGFLYDEALDTGPGYAGFVGAAAVSAALASLYTVAVVPPAHAVLARLLPWLGEGPDEDERRGGFFRLEIRAESVGGRRLRAVVEADGDPGYDETAKMLAESALCLAEDPLDTPGGVLTPAVAMGGSLVARLRAAGVGLRVEVPGD